jgi:copper chaperone CopZ
MKRTLSLTFALLAVAAFAVAPGVSLADSCGHHVVQTTEAKQISAAGHCTAENAGACAAKMGMPVEECQKLCASGEYTMISMSVKGMTCTGCENTITTCLQELPGVVKVGKVSYQDGTAYVMIDPKKVKNEALITAVSNKGYKAEVIPAVAVTPFGQTQTVGDAQHPCGPAAAKACAKKCAKPCGPSGTKTEATKKMDKSGGGTR